jgi:hypothetical protein
MREMAQWGPKLFHEYRFYTAYEEWEDLPYLMRDTSARTTWSLAPIGAITTAVGVEETRQGSQKSSPICGRGRMCPAL